jgi:hypothetical protein
MKRIIAAGLFLLMSCLLCGCSIFYAAYDNALPDNLTRGVIEDSVYSSAYAGLSFTAPEGWVYATDEELAKLMDLGADKLSEAGMEFSEEALNKQVIYDMQAKDPVTGANVLLLYENLALTGSTGITETEYIELTMKQLTDADVYQYEFGEITEAELGGQHYQTVLAEMTDYSVFQHYYVRKLDKYILCVIITLPGTDDMTTTTDCFAAYEEDTGDEI